MAQLQKFVPHSGALIAKPFPGKFGKAVSCYCFAYCCHQRLIIMQIMYRVKARAENLTTAIQVLEVCPALVPTSIALTALLQRP